MCRAAEMEWIGTLKAGELGWEEVRLMAWRAVAV